MARSNWPVPVHFVNNDARVLFGSPYSGQTEALLLSLDLAELLLLPTTEAVRNWAPDSSWAYTRCEMLGHELAEAVEYARLADSTAKGPETPDVRFATLKRRAHQVGIDTERAIAIRQRTRLTATGEPYGRTRHCFIGQDSRYTAVGIVLGDHSVLWELLGSNVRAIRYVQGVDVCAAL